jgi:hexosaminidase
MHVLSWGVACCCNCVQETFSQIVDGAGNCLTNGFSITDAPDFEHRGLMIDTGRRFWPVATVETTIDALSYMKANVLHLHASDFCRESVQSNTYPALQASLTGDFAGFYTQADVAGLIAYAADRGVRVVPEFDVPGHSKGLNPATKYGLEFCEDAGQPQIQIYDDPAGASRQVLKGLLTEMRGVFVDELMHFGADETATTTKCPLSNTKGLEQFVLDVIQTDLNTTAVAWEEILFTTAAANNATIVNGWSRHTATEIVKLGYRAIESDAGAFYLNHVTTPYQGMWKDIAPNTTATQRAMVLGGEASMWTDDTCMSEECGAFGNSVPVGHALFPPAMDEAFTMAMHGIVWPRAAVAMASFWNYDSAVDSTSAAFTDRYRLVTDRLNDRAVPSCPDSCTCDYTQRCGAAYVPCGTPQIGTNVVTYECIAPGAPGGGATSMQWTFNTDGTISLTNNSALCLGLVGTDPSSEQPSIGLAACPSKGTQPGPDLVFEVKLPKIIHTASGHCLDITASDTANGANVETYSCGPDSQSNQAWVVDSTTGEVSTTLDGKCLSACVQAS